ncbi:MAG: hypothetical protein JXA04_01485 [Gammaproteobacteria bacterium]|nr:hypothetical protein [Gammaproteobacteria bacterium]
MTLEYQERMHRREQELFFNKERILRWMRWMRRSKDVHPELQLFEQQLQAENRWFTQRRDVHKTSTLI